MFLRWLSSHAAHALFISSILMTYICYVVRRRPKKLLYKPGTLPRCHFWEGEGSSFFLGGGGCKVDLTTELTPVNSAHSAHSHSDTPPSLCFLVNYGKFVFPIAAKYLVAFRWIGIIIFFLCSLVVSLCAQPWTYITGANLSSLTCRDQKAGHQSR